MKIDLHTHLVTPVFIFIFSFPFFPFFLLHHSIIYPLARSLALALDDKNIFFSFFSAASSFLVRYFSVIWFKYIGRRENGFLYPHYLCTDTQSVRMLMIYFIATLVSHVLSSFRSITNTSLIPQILTFREVIYMEDEMRWKLSLLAFKPGSCCSWKDLKDFNPWTIFKVLKFFCRKWSTFDNPNLTLKLSTKPFDSSITNRTAHQEKTNFSVHQSS